MGHEGLRGSWDPDEALQEVPQRVVAHIDLDCFYCKVADFDLCCLLRE